MRIMKTFLVFIRSANLCLIKMRQEQLIRISTYARRCGVSVQWVYKLIEKKEVKLVEIDGVKFIKL